MTTLDELQRSVERLNRAVERLSGGMGKYGFANVYNDDVQLLLSERAELLAAVAWRDIATAPRDGREIIAYSQDVSGTTGLNPFVSLCAWHPDAGFCTCELREVTHWMPLPPPPSADAAPIKPSADTGELRERVALIVDPAGFDDRWDVPGLRHEASLDERVDEALAKADAILDLIQSEMAG